MICATTLGKPPEVRRPDALVLSKIQASAPGGGRGGSNVLNERNAGSGSGSHRGTSGTRRIASGRGYAKSSRSCRSLEERRIPAAADEGTATPLADAMHMFLQHVRVHSSDKPRTVQWYSAVLAHVRADSGRPDVRGIHLPRGHRRLQVETERRVQRAAQGPADHTADDQLFASEARPGCSL